MFNLVSKKAGIYVDLDWALNLTDGLQHSVFVHKKVPRHSWFSLWLLRHIRLMIKINNQKVIIRRYGDEIFLDLMEEILLWVPSKSVERFRCTCKQWKTLISNPVEREKVHFITYPFFCSYLYSIIFLIGHLLPSSCRVEAFCPL